MLFPVLERRLRGGSCRTTLDRLRLLSAAVRRCRQSPGMFNDDVEFAHYFRFNEIFNERRYQPGDQPGDPPSGDPLPVDWNAVYNMVPNPAMSMFKHRPGLFEKAKEFNQTYAKVLFNIDRACNGEPEILEDGSPLMHALRIAAVDLMNDPIGNGDYTAGPTFEFVPSAIPFTPYCDCRQSASVRITRCKAGLAEPPPRGPIA